MGKLYRATCKRRFTSYPKLWDHEREHWKVTMESPKPLSGAFDTTDSIITVRVGSPNATEFHVHSRKLSSSSQFFQVKFKPHWQGTGSCVELPEQLPSAFLIYSSWLYTGAIHTTVKVDDTTEEPTYTDEYCSLANAYVLGEYLQDPVFEDAVMDSLLSKIQGDGGTTFFEIGAKMVRTLYEGTPPTSPVRLLITDVFTNHVREYYMRSLVGELPADFWQDLAIAFAAKNADPHSGRVQYSASKYRHQDREGK